MPATDRQLASMKQLLKAMVTTTQTATLSVKQTVKLLEMKMVTQMV